MSTSTREEDVKRVKQVKEQTLSSIRKIFKDDIDDILKEVEELSKRGGSNYTIRKSHNDFMIEATCFYLKSIGFFCVIKERTNTHTLELYIAWDEVPKLI